MNDLPRRHVILIWTLVNKYYILLIVAKETSYRNSGSLACRHYCARRPHHKFFAILLGKADIDAVLLLQLVIAGAFYPNYFLQDTRNNYQQLPDISEDKGSLILTVTPNRPVYTLGVKNWFGRCGLPIPSVVDVDEGDGQITVSFEKDDYFTQSDIPLAVYLCLKLGSFKDSYAGVRKVIEPPTPKITSVLQFQPRQVQLSQTVS